MTSNEQVPFGPSMAFSLSGPKATSQIHPIHVPNQGWQGFKVVSNGMFLSQPFETSGKQIQLPFRPPIYRKENKENGLPPGLVQQENKRILVSKTMAVLQGQQQSKVSVVSGEKNKVSFQLQSFNSMRLGPKPIIRLEPRRQRRVSALSATRTTDVSVNVQGLKINVKITPH